MKPILSEDIQMLAEGQAAFCRVLGNSKRVLILWLLMEKEMTINEIALAIDASHQSTLRNLNILEFNKLVKSQRKNHNVFYFSTDKNRIQSCSVLRNKPKALLHETT